MAQGISPPSVPLPPIENFITPISYQNTLVHEIGHAYGSGLVSGFFDTMTVPADASASNQGLTGGWSRWSSSPNVGFMILGAGSTKFVSDVYSNYSQFDLQVVPFKHVPSTGVTTWAVAFNYEEFCADGDLVISHWAVINRSSYASTANTRPRLGYYLSTNKAIKSNDILMSYSNLTVTPYSTAQGLRGADVPPQTPLGVYYTGFYYDSTNLITEQYDGQNSNNSVAMPGLTKVVSCP